VIALTLARDGAHVVVNYNRSRIKAQTTAREIADLGVRAAALRADVSKPRQVEEMFCILKKRFGRLDILVNNAAVFFHRTWEQLTEEDWARTLGINLKGTFFCAQAAARLMLRRRKGVIVNVSSLGGLQAWSGYVHYCSSKAAVIMLTRGLAKALAPHIRVNTVAPGTILFPGEQRGAMIQNVIRTTSVKKAGRAQDIADVVLFLATRAEFITGQVFAVDGGKSIP